MSTILDLPQFADRLQATKRRCLRNLLGNYNIGDDTLNQLVDAVFESGILAGINAAHEMQLYGKDVRECIK